MKQILLICAVVAWVGCGKQEQADANESTPTTNTNEVDGTTEKPVKELTLEDQKALEEKVVGEWSESDGDTGRLIFLDNGFAEHYTNGKKDEEGKWKVVDGEIHADNNGGDIAVLSINKDKSITPIARIDEDGKRRDYPKEQQLTFKKIK